jgi:hypothetical protein
MKSQEELFDELYIQLKDIKENTIIKILEKDLGIWYSISCSTKITSSSNLLILQSYGFVRNIKIKIDYSDSSTFDSNSLSWTIDESFKFEVFPNFNSFFKKFGMLLRNPLLTKEERIIEIKKLFKEFNILTSNQGISNSTVISYNDISYEYSKSLLTIDGHRFSITSEEDSMKFLLMLLELKGSILLHDTAFLRIYGQSNPKPSKVEINRSINLLKERIKTQLIKYSIEEECSKQKINYLFKKIKCERGRGYKLI